MPINELEVVAAGLLVVWCIWRLWRVARAARARQGALTIGLVRAILWPSLVLVAVLAWGVKGCAT